MRSILRILRFVTVTPTAPDGWLTPWREGDPIEAYTYGREVSVPVGTDFRSAWRDITAEEHEEYLRRLEEALNPEPTDEP